MAIARLVKTIKYKVNEMSGLSLVSSNNNEKRND